ncbi:5-deoxyglucuronate isomerase [Raineyella antarctica]|uniref:5-deoxyglucuronate isomerase n=1 Tax=Raineyella antarctica TaxID=1577474 RepID=A0A1G6GEX4_9ACTN|nr:5-deoxy-glucuronate isomerase [Raineyella antarctica]SDB80551.1 5-deoxyglucuronate isomerase [Raineyella antarctica]
MGEWVYPRGSAPEGPWELSVGAAGSAVEVDGWAHTGIKVATTTAGQVLTLPEADEERLVVPLSGSFTVQVVGGERFDLRGRRDVFSGPSDVAYVTPGKAVEITSVVAGTVAVATAPAATGAPSRVVRAEDVPVSVRGTGMCTREVHNFGMPGVLDAEKFLVCEVITPGGNWSSYPPHKHDEITDTENSLEEIYYFQTRAQPGAPEGAGAPIGYARAYSTDDQRPLDITAEVRAGDVILIPHGWHGPAAAAPGYDMYYLNVMAGPGAREWLVTNDPAHAWIPSTMADLPADPRLPLAAQ